MAKKIVKGGAKLLGIGKKKSTAATPTAPIDGQPVVTPLAALSAASPLKKRVGQAVGGLATILGGGGLLGR